mmetsp:Transcript_8069/g.9723  ORF Transcript_8069/g.9723 Transcript_8069/m.9723 type:complete len:271 (+) Transcript_8069:85-897(+)
MVLVVVKNSDEDQFLFETSCKETNENLIHGLVTVQNLRTKLALLAQCLHDLSANEIQEPKLDSTTTSGASDVANAHSSVVEEGRRTEELHELFGKVVKDSRQCLAAEQVRLKIPCTKDLMDEKVDTVRECVEMAQSNGYNKTKLEKIKSVLSNIEEAADTYGLQLLDASSAQLWWAKKPFVRGENVGDRVGTNEKTKIVAQLTAGSSTIPDSITSQSQGEKDTMKAYLLEKQEESKRLLQSSNNNTLNTSWADNQALKNILHGTNSIRFR